MTQHSTGARGRAGRLIGGLLALVTLLALVVGAPVLLVKLAGNPLPHAVPTLDQARQMLTSRDNGQLFLRALVVVAWLAWATFASAVLRELADTLPGLRWLRPGIRWLPSFAPQRSAATALVAAVGMMLHTPVVASAATARPVHAVAVSPAAMTPAAYPLAGWRLAAQPAAVPATSSDLRYVVARGDRLVDIADRFFADPHRYQAIANLNGLHDPNVIHPHQVLQLPTGAVDRGPSRHARGVVVQTGPSTPAPPPQPPPVPPGGDGATPVQPGSPAPGSPAPSTPVPTATAPATSSAPTTSAPNQATPAVSTPDHAVPGDHADDGSSWLVPASAMFGAAGLLAALLLAQLYRRRARQQQHRRTYRRIVQPTSPAVEVAARAAAQADDAARLDTGLRALSAGLHGRDVTTIPDVVVTWMDAGTLNLLLAEPCLDPPNPFVAVTETRWALPADATVTDEEGPLAPLPLLATIASQPGGQHLLLDLERIGVLGLAGDTARCLDLLRYLVAELATNWWSDDVEVVVAGLDPDQVDQLVALNSERVSAAASTADALARVRRRALAAAASVTATGAGSTLAGRINDVAADGWMPHVLLLAAGDDEALNDELAELDDLLQELGRAAVAVVVAGGQSTWTLNVAADGDLRADWLHHNGAKAAQLTADQLAELAFAMATARTTRPASAFDPAVEPLDEPVPPAADDAPWATGVDAHGAALTDAGTDADDRRQPVLEADLDAELAAPQVPAVEVELTDLADRDDALNPGAGSRATTTSVFHLSAGSDVTSIELPALTSTVPIAGATARPPRRARGDYADPSLDDDLAAWHRPDEQRPRIAVLGPPTLDAPGQPPKERPRFYTEIAVFLAVRGARGATADEVEDALWPGSGTKGTSLRVAMSRTRRWLGEGPDGQPWLPSAGDGDHSYRLRPGVLLDWDLFRRLRARAGQPDAARVDDLRAALDLVRGAPLDGADRGYGGQSRNPYPWLPGSDIQPFNLLAAIVDTAHELADTALDDNDVLTAKWAVAQAWRADPDKLNDQPWWDAFRIARVEGHTTELRALLGELMNRRDAEVPEELSPATYQVVERYMGDLLKAP